MLLTIMELKLNPIFTFFSTWQSKMAIPLPPHKKNNFKYFNCISMNPEMLLKQNKTRYIQFDINILH